MSDGIDRCMAKLDEIETKFDEIDALCTKIERRWIYLTIYVAVLWAGLISYTAYLVLSR